MASYGSRDAKNRVKPGGDLGSNQYFYTTDKTTGEITVTRAGSDSTEDVVVGTIPQGGKFTPSTNASAAETEFANDNIGSIRSQATNIATREWDGREKPNPQQLIYGSNAIQAGFDAAGVTDAANSLKDPSVWGGVADFLTGGLTDFDGQGGPRFGLAALLPPRQQPPKKKNYKNPGGGAWVYPNALRKAKQDFLKIDMLEYKPKQREDDPEGTGNLSGWKDRGPLKNRKSIGTVMLPIPGGITSTDNVQWGGDKMDPAQTAMANIALTGIQEGLGKGVDELAKSTQAAVGSEDTRKALSTAIASAASGAGAQLLQRTEGAIINPNMELLFKDPGLRTFNFTWKLAPRSAAEARTVIAIIKFFKAGMAVKKSESNLFLKAPNTWRLAYKRPNDGTHPYLNLFKECAMTSFTVDYTPDGNYATFEDGVMTSYNITCGFNELEPIFENDYSSGFDSIGY